MSVKHVLEYLENTAHRVPERIAFSDEEGAVSFAGLYAAARAIGSAVAERIPPRRPVVLLLNDRSVACVTAMLGVLYAGCCYVPLDAGLPAERLRLIADRLQPALVLQDDRGAAAAACFSCERLAYAQAVAHETAHQALAERRAQASAEDPMSILYTSGSTGIPKGVVQSVRSYIRFTAATVEKFDFTEETVFGNQSPFFYANSIMDIFPTLALGARTVILPAMALTFPRVLMERLSRQRITGLTMTPSSYMKVASSGILTEDSLPHLRHLIFLGEAAHWATMEAWQKAAPGCGIWNFYGSSETYSVAAWRIDRAGWEGRTIPAGTLLDGVEIRFVNEEGAPSGQGEMMIHTPWLADGYARDALRTESAFFTAEDGRRFYRSGDLGRFNGENQLVVTGRRDAQIKHMGYRMEIGETELALHAVEGVEDGCCLFDRESGVLHCFYTGLTEPRALLAALKRKLPRYAIPDRFHHLQALPYTVNMKLNRQELRDMMRDEGGCAGHREQVQRENQKIQLNPEEG